VDHVEDCHPCARFDRFGACRTASRSTALFDIIVATPAGSPLNFSRDVTMFSIPVKMWSNASANDCISCGRRVAELVGIASATHAARRMIERMPSILVSVLDRLTEETGRISLRTVHRKM